MAKICDLPMQPVTARAGFVAEPQSLTVSLAQALDKLADVIGAVQKLPRWRTSPPRAPSVRRDNQDENRPTIRMRIRRREDSEGRA
jgi:hypothetical protein